MFGHIHGMSGDGGGGGSACFMLFTRKKRSLPPLEFKCLPFCRDADLWEQRVGESGAAERAGLAWRAVAHSTVLSMSRGPAGLGRTRPLRIAWCGCQHRAEPWMGLSAHWKILFLKTVCVCSVVSNSLWPRGLYPPSLLCPWHSPARILEWVDIPPGDLPDPGIELKSLASFALAGRFFTTSATWTVLCLKA